MKLLFLLISSLLIILATITTVYTSSDEKTAKIFAIGGENRKRDPSVEVYDFETAKWYTIAPLPLRRSYLGAATLDETVYVIGGQDGVTKLDTVDAFDESTQNWKSAPNMNYNRTWLGVSVLNGKIYATGGWNGDAFLKSTEVFDPQLGKWTEFGQEMNQSRLNFAVGTLKESIYAVGGSKEKTV